MADLSMRVSDQSVRLGVIRVVDWFCKAAELVFLRLGTLAFAGFRCGWLGFAGFGIARL